MMAKTLLVERRGGALLPADPWSAELLEELAEHVVLKATLTSDRSHGTTNKWWAGLAYAVQRFEGDLARHYPTARHLHKAFLTKLGYVEPIYLIGGGVRFEVDSIRFEAMDEADFRALFEKARVQALEWLGYDPWDAWEQHKDAEKRARIEAMRRGQQ